jgi:hypothetical protein
MKIMQQAVLPKDWWEPLPSFILPKRKRRVFKVSRHGFICIYLLGNQNIQIQWQVKNKKGEVVTAVDLPLEKLNDVRLVQGTSPVVTLW